MRLLWQPNPIWKEALVLSALKVKVQASGDKVKDILKASNSLFELQWERETSGSPVC